MPPTHNARTKLHTCSMQTKPLAKLPEQAQHTLHELGTKGGVCCVFVLDCEAKVGSKRCSSWPMRTVCVCSCGWWPNTQELFCLWLVTNLNKQLLVPGAQRANARQPFAFRSPPPPPLDCSSQRHSATTAITITHLPPPAAQRRPLAFVASLHSQLKAINHNPFQRGPRVVCCRFDSGACSAAASRGAGGERGA